MNQTLFNDYKLTLENFEGPFDLLYHLIEKNEMDIYDIKISEITEQYLEFLFDMKSIDMELASEFLVMAATLLHIKSKLLLPIIVDEQEEEIDPREQLVLQLLEYKKFKNASFQLKKQHVEGMKSFYGQRSVEDFGSTKKVYEVSPSILKEMYKLIVTRNERKKNYKIRYMEKILKHDKFTVEKRIKHVIRTLFRKKKINFTETFKVKGAESLEIVVSFLSILELAKEKKAKLTQKKAFSDITVEKTDLLKEEDFEDILDEIQ